MNGKVYLVGAGPGDPELLTVKGLRLLKTADAVLHDDLVSPEILKLIPTTAQVHNVGKRCGNKTIVQEEINFLMVALAQAGLRVIRLKSGDPLIFFVPAGLMRGGGARVQLPARSTATMQPSSSKSCRDENRQTSSTKAAKSCSTGKAAKR